MRRHRDPRDDSPKRQRILDGARHQSAKLFDWQSPAAFRATLDALDILIAEHNRLLGVSGSHRDRIFRHWREGWVLQHIFEHLGVHMARLEHGGANLPDAELKLAHESTVVVEITEGMSSSHQPWLRLPPGVYDGDFDQWRANAAEVPYLLEAASRRKASKPSNARPIKVQDICATERQPTLLGADTVLDNPCPLAATTEANAEAGQGVVEHDQFRLPGG